MMKEELNKVVKVDQEQLLELNKKAEIFKFGMEQENTKLLSQIQEQSILIGNHVKSLEKL